MNNILSQSEKIKIVKILIVEDEYILAINLQETLESLGYSVPAIADSGEEAIEKAAELRPNLVVMDIRLRGEMDGIQAAEHIWNHLQIPVIYITGHSDKSTVERATLTLSFGYLLKPFKEQELHIAIQTALHRYEREQFLNTVLREMADGVVVVDSQLRVHYLNPIAEELTGWELNQAKGRVLTDVLSLLDEKTQLPTDNPLAIALQQRTTVYLGSNVVLRSKNGTMIPVADSATPLRDNDGEMTGGVMVFWDDTRRRLIEERNLEAERGRQLEIQVAELKRLNQLKEDFLATTSHEMRAPLSNIKMALVMLEAFLEQQGILNSENIPVSASINRYLNILREQCEQEISLVDDLLNLRRLDAQTYPLELSSIALQDWLPHLLESFEQRTQAQQQMLQVTIPANLPPLISDLASLTRIVSELVNNACKYTPPGERIVISALVIYDGDAESDLAPQLPVPFFEIRVSNSGVEISTAQRARIFEPFYRIPQSDHWKHGGTGLGLALVKKIVEYLQGRIDVTSTQGWTTFIVQLPGSYLLGKM
jgi:PAS domain S-box-containing protein